MTARSLNVNIDPAICICFGHTDTTYEEQVYDFCCVLQYDVKGRPIGLHWVKQEAYAIG